MPGRLTRLTTLNATNTTRPPRPRLRPRGLPPALEPHGIYSATNPAEAALFGQDLFGPHRIRVDPGDVHDFVASFHGVLVRDLTLGYLDYATAVTVEIERLPDDHLVIVPATGASRVETAGVVVETSPVRAAVPRPGQRVTITCDADTAHLVMRIDRAALDVYLSRLLGRMPDDPLVFEPSFDLARPQASRWNAAIQMLHAELYEPASLLHEGVGHGALEEFVMSSLLLSLSSNHRDALAAPTRQERRTVRAARDFVERNLTRPLTVHDIATAAGTSVRTLQNQFREDRHQTPMDYVRNRRLERIRDDLADASPDRGVTVTDVATRWGVTHLGRFAVAYRSRFGETPSQTLRS